jgi:hypothetical protein
MAVEGMSDPDASLLDIGVNLVLGMGVAPLAALEAPITGLYNAPNNAARAGQNLARANLTDDDDAAVVGRLAATAELAGAFVGFGGPATLITPRPLLKTPISRTGPVADDMLADSELLTNRTSGVNELAAQSDSAGLSVKYYSGDVYSPDFVGPVEWQYFYRGDETLRTTFTSSLAERQGINASKARYLDAENNGLIDDLFDTHGNIGSQDLPTIGVSKDPVVAEYFARDGGKRPGFVTEFKMQKHEFERLASRNYENRRDIFDINSEIGRPEQEFLFNSIIPGRAIVNQWQVR